jgi:uncharacterized protein (DUF697 family)
MENKTENKNQGAATKAAQIVRSHMFGSVAAGILPIPLLDAGILAAIHLRMVHKLADLYEVEYSEQRANAIIGSLVGVSITATAVSMLRMIPGFGQALLGVGALTLPPASTYALGQVFIKHFESGGTFMTFDTKRAKEDYDEKIEDGKRVVEQSYSGIKP